MAKDKEVFAEFRPIALVYFRFYKFVIMTTYVIGDIHGAARALDQCLERAGVNLDADRLIQLGDVTDSYPEVFECVETLLKAKELIAIKGNHDDWFHEFVLTGIHPYHWNQGGRGTLKSYLAHVNKAGQYKSSDGGFITALSPSDIPVRHRQFFDRQQLYYIDEKRRCFVHAGFKPGVQFDRQNPVDFFWDRTLWSNAYQHRLRTVNTDRINPFGGVAEFSEVYLGHTPTINWGSDLPLQAFNLWNLDTGAGHDGRLTIMDVDTQQYWQSDPLPRLYARNFR